MNGKLIKTLGITLLGASMAMVAIPVNADNLTAERAQRLMFTPQNDGNQFSMSTNEELIFRVDGLDLPAKLVKGVDISKCEVSRRNPGANVIAAATVTDAKHGIIRVKAGPATGSARVHLKCRSQQISVVVRVS